MAEGRPYNIENGRIEGADLSNLRGPGASPSIGERGVPQTGIARIAGLAILGILLVSFSGCGDNVAETAGFVADGGLRSHRGSFQARLLLTGELQAVEADTIIVPRTPNWQMPIRWMEDDGAAVTQGQRVLELDSTQFSSDLQERRLTAARARNQLLQKRSDIAVDLSDKRFAAEQARIQLEKNRIEAAVPEALRPRREHQEKQLELVRAEVEREKALEELDAAQRASESELEELEIALARARRDVQTADDAIESLTLFAPRDGILIAAENRQEGRKYQVGDNVWVGLAVMQIPELSRMKVDALLSDVDDGKIGTGMLAVCTLDTYPDIQFIGRVTSITPIAKEQGRQSLRRAFHVEIMLDSADPDRMRPGMTVKVEILPPPRHDALIIPRASIDFSADTPQVLLTDRSWIGVELGPCNALECVVEEGLAEGVRVAAHGSQR